MAIAIMCAAPWAINAGLRFRAVMTSWRNVRFDFQGSYLRAAYVFLLLPFIATVSFGLLAPVASRLAGRYLANGHHYGGAPNSTANPGWARCMPASAAASCCSSRSWF